MTKLNLGKWTFLVAALAAIGCGSESVNGNGVSIDRSTHALSSGALLFANGTYGAGCTQRSGSWSVAIDGYAGALTNPELSVVKNNSDCVLTVTSLVADQSYDGSPTIPLQASYQSSASAFSAGGPVVFYANARISDASFGGSFVVTILYSDDPAAASAQNSASYAVSNASAESSQVASPDYTLDMTGVQVQTDQNKIVQSAAGSALLTDGSVAGDSWVVVSSLASSSYADIDTAFTGATATAISGPDPTVPASAFSLGGIDLSSGATRYLIVANSSNGVRSYQLFTITFNAPN